MKSLDIENIDNAIRYCDRVVEDRNIDINHINGFLSGIHVPKHSNFIRSYFTINIFIKESYHSRREELNYIKNYNYDLSSILEKFKNENSAIEKSSLFKLINDSTESLEAFIEKQFPESVDNCHRKEIASNLNDAKKIIK